MEGVAKLTYATFATVVVSSKRAATSATGGRADGAVRISPRTIAASAAVRRAA
jgi:hypothetical protein